MWTVDKSKKVSAILAKPSSGLHGIYKDGEVFTGTYTGAEWQALSSEEKTTVLQACSSKKNGKGKGGKGQAKRIQALTKKIQNQKKEIASLKKRSSPSEEPDSDSEKEEPANDAGNSFGGRAGKAASKRHKKTD